MRAIPFIFFGILFLLAGYAAWNARSKKKSLRRSKYNAMKQSRDEAYYMLANIHDIARNAVTIGCDPNSHLAFQNILDQTSKINNKELEV